MHLFKKIDYFSIMLENVTLSGILRKFGYDPGVVGNDFIFTRYDIDHSYERIVRFSMPDFRANVYLWYGEGLPDDQTIYNSYMIEFLEKVQPKIKLEMAGSELDNFRIRGFFPEKVFSDPRYFDDIASAARLTRCDFAFDFIDHPDEPMLPEKLCIFLNDMAAQRRFYLNTADHRKGGIKFDTKFNSSEACAYIGRMGSPEFVRVYDKKLEMEYKYGVELACLPDQFSEEYRAARSWTRIELQARRDKAQKLLYQNSDPDRLMESVLKHIFTRYCLCDRDGNPFPLFEKYFDYRSLPSGSFVYFGEKVVNDTETALNQFFFKYFKKILALAGMFSVPELVNQCNNYLDYLYHSKTGTKGADILSKISAYLASLCIQKQTRIEDFPGFIIRDGHLYLSLDKFDFDKEFGDDECERDSE